MSVILRNGYHGYMYLFHDLADHRLMSWPFVAKPYQVLAILALYLMFVLKWGPKWMKHRQPFNLDSIMIVYNAMQVVACAYLFWKALDLGWGRKYKWVCEPANFSTDSQGMDVAKVTYYYLMVKIADLLDTVFFVLRKKNKQVSFLHLYHHTGMVLLVWGSVTYVPGGHGSLIGVMNCLVHMVMYTYYLLSVAMPTVKHAIWLKKHVTQLQIIQFFIGVVHMSSLVFKTDCAYPRWVSALFLPQDLFMLALFIDFYIKTYIRNPKKRAKEELNGNVFVNKKLNAQNNDVKTLKTDLNQFDNGARMRNIDSQNGYKTKHNHCENVFENSNLKYTKND